jgi:hypothetical protein
VSNPATFHVHIDATSTSPTFEDVITHALGFSSADFDDSVPETDSFQPARHFTLKPHDALEFKSAFEAVVNAAESTGGLEGYIEGEFIPLDCSIPSGDFNPEVPPPFRISRCQLPMGGFRESEIHISVNRNRSDQRLGDVLRSMGFFVANILKPSGLAQIFTVQGTRGQIDALLPATQSYLSLAGGAVNGSIKEERIARWWVSNPRLTLPPVISQIHWL